MPATSQQCLELQPEFGPYQEALIDKPGLYCVATDFWQQRMSGAGHSGPGVWRHLVNVGASNVTIDLMNHILHSGGHSSGIIVSLDAKNANVNSSRQQYGTRARNITIKNGVIDLRGLGTAVASPDKWNVYRIDKPISDGLNGYEKSNLTLENLLIKTDNVGIALEGDGNIIRNCIIESGGSAAITMAGPNGQIINNTIVLTNPIIPGSMGGVGLDNIEPRHFAEYQKGKKAPKAAIALHQATGTIISGNRIEVKGKSATRHNIYLSNGSKDVRIEGNTIVGADDPVTLLEGSTAELKNNVFEPRKSQWWKF